MLSAAQLIASKPLLLQVAPALSRWVSAGSSWRSLHASTPASAIVEVHTDAEFKGIIDKIAENQGLAIVDFTAKWCGPCKFIAPHYESMSVDYPQVKFLKIDIDNHGLQATVNDHGITGVPTFTMYRGARRVESFTGARLDHLRAVIAKHAEAAAEAAPAAAAPAS